MSDYADPTQRDTAVIPIPPASGGYPPNSVPGQPTYQQFAPGATAGGQPGTDVPGPAFAGGYPMSGSMPGVDPGAHWYAQFRKQRRRTRVLALSTALLAIACVLLTGTALALFRANDLTSQVSGVLPGVSGLIGRPDPTAPTPGPASTLDAPSNGDGDSLPQTPPQSPNLPGTSPLPEAAPTGDPDLAELTELVAGLKNEDGSLNPLGVAALAGKLGSLSQDPQKLNALIDQAQQQGLIDSQVAGLLRGVLAGTNSAG